MNVVLMTTETLDGFSYDIAENLRKSNAYDFIGLLSVEVAIKKRSLVSRFVNSVSEKGIFFTWLRLFSKFKKGYSLKSVYENDYNEHVSFKPIPVSEYGRTHNIPVWISSEVNSLETAELLKMAFSDYVVSYGLGILRPILIDAGNTIFINGHAGKLPFFGGMNVVEWAVLLNQPVYGTVHKIEKGIDTGPILLERKLTLGRPKTVQQLRMEAFEKTWKMVPQALEGLSTGNLRFKKQFDDKNRRIWYRMHPFLIKLVQAKLNDQSFIKTQETSRL